VLCLIVLRASPPRVAVGARGADIVGDEQKAGVYVYRARFPAGFKVRPHFHPDERVVTVISGTVLIGYSDKFEETVMKALYRAFMKDAGGPHISLLDVLYGACGGAAIRSQPDGTFVFHAA
jgi:uncharacterized RmlC-like cupin family protein